MQRFSSIFSQLLQLFPRTEFEQAVSEHGAERHARGFPSWSQFIGMLFCQLGRAQTLREVCGGLASVEGKLRHLGLEDAPKRSTLAYANAHRPWRLYRTVFEQLLGRCEAAVKERGVRRFRFKNKLMSLDSSVIDLSLSLYDWAHFRRRKGAIKLHLVLDHDGYLPHFADITDGKTSDITAARRMRFERGTVLAMDRGYIDYAWFVELTLQGVDFVTRLKSNAVYNVVEDRPVPEGATHILSDQVIYFPGHAEPSDEFFFRKVEAWDPDKNKPIVFVTNNMKFDAPTVAAIYRDRWAIETFFKTIKQNLKIKTFLGTSANAVQTQLWTALIAILLLKYLKLRSTFGWSLSNLAALLRHQLFVYRNLWDWLNAPFRGPPAADAILAQQLDLQFHR